MGVVGGEAMVDRGLIGVGGRSGMMTARATETAPLNRVFFALLD